MITFVWNICLAVIWAAATEQLSLSNLLTGYLLAYLILWFIQPVTGRTRYFSKVWQTIAFSMFFVKELIVANLRIAVEVVTPRHSMQPGVVAVPLAAETELEITLLANLITLTPGTLSLDVSEDRRVLYIHSMYIDGAETFRRQIKDGFERRLLELLR